MKKSLSIIIGIIIGILGTSFYFKSTHISKKEIPHIQKSYLIQAMLIERNRVQMNYDLYLQNFKKNPKSLARKKYITTCSTIV